MISTSFIYFYFPSVIHDGPNRKKNTDTCCPGITSSSTLCDLIATKNATTISLCNNRCHTRRKTAKVQYVFFKPDGSSKGSETVGLTRSMKCRNPVQISAPQTQPHTHTQKHKEYAPLITRAHTRTRTTYEVPGRFQTQVPEW